ncbi:MAG: acyl-ACP thioesterase domain-containing protein [Acidimicrobiales bacterium]
MREFVDRPSVGRTFAATRRVGLGDADAAGRLRVDGFARYLQDVANDDWDDASVEGDDVWVVRRASIDAPGPWPMLGDHVRLVTWCAGTGAAWAERRTDLELGGRVVARATSLWVPIGPDGRPRRVRAQFADVYGEASRGRRVSGRIEAASVPPGARRRAWPLRRSDIDVVGHVNNAVAWQAVAEVAPAVVAAADVTYHGAIEIDDDVVLAHDGGSLWLCVGDEVRVSGRVEGH